MTRRFWYLATPYSRFAEGIHAAFVEAATQAAHLLRAGIAVFCPIAHSHPIAVHGDIDPCDYDVWIPADRPMMDAAFGLIVCKLPGWAESEGIGIEIEEFKSAGKPIVCMKPGVVPLREIRGAEEIGAVADDMVRGRGGCAARPDP